ncbi:pyridoxal phosphate-dependent aminotransferase [Novosphingobium sp. 9]|uniref:pyridoxal phosphate-dependent aminotransferase n=1 Tax=Novosphingobium sp. 9 TaxID=2025349 RepID=UPI0021B5D602|nr:pyridoxal phosphate-dependent aminotransferase [Novosphingobium sp. 9]
MRDVARELPGSLIRSIANAAMGTPGLIPLWFGESDLPTAPVIVEAARESLLRGETRYGPNLGLPELREGLDRYQRRLFATSAGFGNIAVTSSGLNALLLTLSALVDPGDEVIVPVPTWPNLLAIPKVLSATVREVPLRLSNARFDLPVDDILAACTERTRVVLINSPQNPTGWRMPPQDMARLVEELDRRGIWLLADEVYSRILPEGVAPASFLEHFDERRRIVVVNSYSKTWSMTGWRLGWITAPAELVQAFERLIEFNTSCAPDFVQRGGLAALGEEGETFVAMQRARLEAARLAAIEVLGSDPRIELPEIGGAFYLFPRIEGLTDGVALARKAVELGVGIAPGEGFGEEGRGHLRLCFARDPAEIRTAMERLLEALKA